MKIKIIYFYILIIGISISCSKKSSDNSIIYEDIIPDKIVTSFINPNSDYNSYTAMSSYDLDLNQDRFPDFEFSIKHVPADSINTYKDEFQIEIRDISQYLSEYNSLDSKFSIETNNDFQFPFVKLYDHGDTLEDNFIDNIGWLYKVDEEDSCTTEGDFFVGLQLVERLENNKQNKYYGWIHVEINFWEIIFKDYAYSTIPNRKIKLGMIE